MWRKTELNVGRFFKVNGMLQYYILNCLRACPLCQVVQDSFEGESFSLLGARQYFSLGAPKQGLRTIIFLFTIISI